MIMDMIHISPDIYTKFGVDRISPVMTCAIFHGALHFAQYYQPNLLAADIAAIRLGFSIMRKRWAIGGTQQSSWILHKLT